LARSAWRSALEWLFALNLAAFALSGLLTLTSWTFMEALALSLFLEAGVLLLVGGGMDMSSSVFFTEARQRVFGSKEEYSALRHREAQRRGRRLVALGAALLLESVLFALL